VALNFPCRDKKSKTGKYRKEARVMGTADADEPICTRNYQNKKSSHVDKDLWKFKPKPIT